MSKDILVLFLLLRDINDVKYTGYHSDRYFVVERASVGKLGEMSVCKDIFTGSRAGLYGKSSKACRSVSTLDFCRSADMGHCPYLLIFSNV